MMWLRRDVKFHKFHHRRCRLLHLVKFLLTVSIVLCVYLVQKSDVTPHGINSDSFIRIFRKSSEELAFDREIDEDLAKQVPGLCSGGVECFMPADDVLLGDASYEANGINVLLSDRISYNRTPPNVRHDLCTMANFDSVSLPSASVIIIFYEEPYSVLLRTVHSVLNTSPSMLLKEIILVDDFSSFADLKGKLRNYVKHRLPDKVKLVRLDKQ